MREDFLTEKMKLPVWMSIKKASIDKLDIKISWAKIKTKPIRVVCSSFASEMDLLLKKLIVWKEKMKKTESKGET